ncbi:DUF7691 family protein [Streptomyces flavofungini]|uniref:DUF7691 domain-containing protein n=1 Tax=Streptomyces flavofungini TaxID=68200 RepID=A0ABS0XBE4_9ACTN|nr:hypothetical protein [Streptomyces flavofungini]MBJ3810539.1 hypothetical protein [Streptomyces flavofungini]GHC84074.1 hypothetical protein GCM10010349_68800 [Streptomyces flavofungini]
MSLSLSVFLVDVSAARGLVGSGDEQLLQVIRDEFGGDLARDDDWFSSEIAQGVPTAYEALRAVVHGGPFPKGGSHEAFQYAYAYRRLVSLTGGRLDNSSFSPFRWGWLGMVDEALRELGVSAVSVEDFGMSDGLPGDLPWPAEFPGCGEWTHEQCRKALEQLREAERAQRVPPADPAVARAVEDCAAWIISAAQRPGYGVIGFQS